MRGVVVVAALVLAGCNPQAPVQTAPTSGQSFSYASKASDTVNTYTCAAKGPGGGTAEARSKAMHAFFEAETTAFAARQTADMMQAYGTNDPAKIKASEQRLDKAADAFADRMYSEGDAKFKCVLSSSKDI